MPTDPAPRSRGFTAQAAACLTTLLLAFTAGAPPAEAQSQSDWRRFTSPDLGLSISMPYHLIDGELDEDSLDTIPLRGRAALYLNMSPLGDERLETFVKRAVLNGIDVTYQRKKGNWIAYSGFAGDEIVYGRTVLSCGGRYAHSFVIAYPAALRPTYDPVVTRLSHSLRPDPSFEARNC